MTDERADLFSFLNVSRETERRLDHYVALLEKWTKRINLVSPASMAQVWSRHMRDSAQLLSLAPGAAQAWVDLGSGGGFPGAVVAILASETRPELEVALVESDQRKAAFLRTVARETGVPLTVYADRIEELARLEADVVSARALAPLPQLLGLVSRHMSATGIALLPKGAAWQKERVLALEQWAFDCEAHPSITDADAVILEIGEIKRV